MTKYSHIYQTIPGWFNFEDIYSGIVKEAKDGDIFVEVGAWLGKSTSYMIIEILNSNKNIEFHVVDTWLGSSEHQAYIKKYGDPFIQFKKNLKDYLKYLNIHKVPSVEASKLFKDKIIKFCFIDASHKYEDVKADIEAWLPKIKKDGILAGHDYSNDWPGVKQAVREKLSHFKVANTSWVYRVK